MITCKWKNKLIQLKDKENTLYGYGGGNCPLVITTKDKNLVNFANDTKDLKSIVEWARKNKLSVTLYRPLDSYDRKTTDTIIKWLIQLNITFKYKGANK